MNRMQRMLTQRLRLMFVLVAIFMQLLGSSVVLPKPQPDAVTFILPSSTHLSSSYLITIQQIRSGQFIGWNLPIELQIQHIHSIGTEQYLGNINEPYHISLAFNRETQLNTRESLPQGYWLRHLSVSLLLYSANMLEENELELTLSIGNHSHTEKFTLLHLFTDAKVESLLQNFAPESVQEGRSYFLAGFHACNLPMLVQLAGVRYDFFLADETLSFTQSKLPQSLCRGNINQTALPKSTRFWSTPDSQMHSLGFVQHSILLVDHLLMYFYNTNNFDAVNGLCTSQINTVEDLLVSSIACQKHKSKVIGIFASYMMQLVVRTRRSSLLIMSPAIRQLLLTSSAIDKYEKDAMQWLQMLREKNLNDLCGVYEPVRFSLKDSFGSIDTFLVPGLETWLLDTSDIAAIAACLRTKVTVQNDRLSLQSKLIRRELTIGKPYIAFENICVSKDESNDPLNTLETSGRLRFLIFHDQEGDLLNVDDYTDEDYGFAYTGYRFTHVHTNKFTTGQFREMVQRTKWIPGNTGIVMSAQPNHMSHDSEVLAQLVSTSFRFLTCLEGIMESIPQSAADVHQQLQTCRYYSNHFQDIIPSLDRIILMKSISYGVGDWIRSMVSLYLQYFHDRVALAVKRSPHLASMLNLSLPLQYYRDDLFQNTGDVCFEKVILFGRSNGHITYFTSQAVGNDVKCFLFAHYQLAVESHPLLDFTKICPHDKLNVLHRPMDSVENAHRNRKVKITITIRSGEGRQYLNLVQLQQMILNELSEVALPYPIDAEWLMTHIVHLGSLSVHEQMEIFSQTDIVIVGHGAEVMNALFMRAGSVIIDVFQGAYYENYFQPMLIELGLHLIPLTVSNHFLQNECLQQIPAKCTAGSLVFGGSLDCLPVRQCNLNFDLKQVKHILQQSYFYLLSGKFLYPSDKL